MRPFVLVLLCVAAAGCAGSEEEPERRPAPAVRGDANERLIGRWVGAVRRGDYGTAAGFFARGAIVDQGVPLRLRDRRAAIAFNRSLPCKATLSGVEKQSRGRVLGTFRLSPRRRGAEGPCEGEARVRFTIRGGRFTEWRQLPGAPPPSGEPV